MFLFQISRRTLITKVSRSICLTNSIGELKYFFSSVKTGNCESAKGAFTLVTLQSAKNVKTTGLKGPLVKKTLTGFTARITGLPVLDGETNFKATCKNFKNKNCLFPCKCYKIRLMSWFVCLLASCGV